MTEEAEDTEVLDLSGAKHDLWLVKVPKGLATKWLNAPEDGAVGKLRLTKNGGRTDVTYTMDPTLEQTEIPGTKAVPSQHKFVLQGVGQQNLAVFSLSSRAPKVGEKRSVEGRIVQRVDCRPVISDKYMQLKKAQMIDACRPNRTTRQLASAVKSVYKPVAITEEEKADRLRKKEQGKKIRMEKEELQQKLFEAFEKHQYYSIKDLRNITLQPTSFLSEVLREIGVYSQHPDHRNMWELKEEYRHHKTD